MKLADRLHYFWESRTRERLEPYGWGLAAMSGWFLADAAFPSVSFPSSEAVLTSAITFGSIVIGFMATCMVLMVSISTPRMDQVRDSKYIDSLMTYLWEAIACGLILVAVNMAGFFLPAVNTAYAAVWCGVLCATFATITRVAPIILALIRK